MLPSIHNTNSILIIADRQILCINQPSNSERGMSSAVNSTGRVRGASFTTRTRNRSFCHSNYRLLIIFIFLVLLIKFIITSQIDLKSRKVNILCYATLYTNHTTIYICTSTEEARGPSIFYADSHFIHVSIDLLCEEVDFKPSLLGIQKKMLHTFFSGVFFSSTKERQLNLNKIIIWRSVLLE